MERLEIHLLDRRQHKPRQMPIRQPVTHVRRHQKRLLTITRDEALSHHEIVLNPRTSPRLTRQPQAEPAAATESAALPLPDDDQQSIEIGAPLLRAKRERTHTIRNCD
jgi:hypothetical protein